MSAAPETTFFLTPLVCLMAMCGPCTWNTRTSWRNQVLMLVSWHFVKCFSVFLMFVLMRCACRYSAARWNHVKGAALQLRLREHPEHHAGTSLTKVPNPPGTWARNGFIVLLWLNVVSAGHPIGYTKRLLHLQPEDQLSLTSYQAVVQFDCHTFLFYFLRLFSSIRCWDDFYIHHIYCFVTGNVRGWLHMSINDPSANFCLGLTCNWILFWVGPAQWGTWRSW